MFLVIHKSEQRDMNSLEHLYAFESWFSDSITSINLHLRAQV